MTHEEAISWARSTNAASARMTVKQASDFLAAYLEARGAVLVPAQPTEAMVASGKLAESIAAGFGEDWDTRVADIYRGMLAALSDNPKGDGNGR